MPLRCGCRQCGARGPRWGSADEVALRAWPFALTQAEALAREVQCSLELGATHVNVVRPHELLLTQTHVVLATQFEKGGTLAAHCATHEVDEPTACYFLRQFASALAHCHARQIAFRDVKLDNMLLDGSRPPTLRLCDFGVARRWSATPAGKAADAGGLRTLAGTPGFLSPQVLGVLFGAAGGSGYNGAAADVWSAGVVLVVMLLHKLPFGYTRVAKSLDGPARLRTAWEAELRGRWRGGDAALTAALSADVLDLIDRMLEPDEAKRITMEGVRAHAWYNQRLPAAMQAALDAQAAMQAARDGATVGYDLHATDSAIEEVANKAMMARGKTPGIEARLSLVPDACRRRSMTSLDIPMPRPPAAADAADVAADAPA
jgi:serine/threonine protein kinase